MEGAKKNLLTDDHITTEKVEGEKLMIEEKNHSQVK